MIARCRTGPMSRANLALPPMSSANSPLPAPLFQPLSTQEVARRALVWSALAELWLDTELSPADLAQIAAVLSRSGYSIRELEAICRDEVAPVVACNLRCVAGVWTGFNDAQLRQAILDRRRQPPLFDRLLKALHLHRPLVLGAAAQEWHAIVALLQSRAG
jgi:hypothetical protein